MTDLTLLDATDLAARLRNRTASAAEVMAAHLERIERLNPAINAIVSQRPRADLMAEAEALDRSGRNAGPLHGMPMAVKDLVATKGIRTTWGSPLHAGHVPAADDLLAARLKAAGAILIGKTNTPEFGLGSHSFNPVHGVTRNPYDLSRTAGGSSGGAGAALAARLVPLADGSDQMGSIRNPAAFGNVYGLRPSWGLVPGEPDGEMFVSTFSTDGPMGRSPADCALLLGVIGGPDPRAPFGRNLPDLTLKPQAKGKRIGWLGDWGGAYPTEPGILPLIEATLGRFEELGSVVEPVAPPYTAERIWQAWMTLRAWQKGNSYAETYADPAKRAKLKPALIWEIEQGRTVTPEALWQASVIRSDLYRAFARLFTRYDALAMPSAQVWPFPVEWVHPERIVDRPMDTYHRWMEIVVPVSLTGLPSLGTPAGFSAQGLPTGFQLIGSTGSDAAILSLGQAYHEATRWPDRLPPPT